VPPHIAVSVHLRHAGHDHPRHTEKKQEAALSDGAWQQPAEGIACVDSMTFYSYESVYT